MCESCSEAPVRTSAAAFPCLRWGWVEGPAALGGGELQPAVGLTPPPPFQEDRCPGGPLIYTNSTRNFLLLTSSEAGVWRCGSGERSDEGLEHCSSALWNSLSLYNRDAGPLRGGPGKEAPGRLPFTELVSSKFPLGKTSLTVISSEQP